MYIHIYNRHNIIIHICRYSIAKRSLAPFSRLAFYKAAVTLNICLRTAKCLYKSKQFVLYVEKKFKPLHDHL